MSKIYNGENFERWAKIVEKEDRIIIQDLKRGSMINMEGYDITVPGTYKDRQVYLPDDCSLLFAGLPVPYLSHQEITIDLSQIKDTSNVTNMNGMFQGYPADDSPNGDDYHPYKLAYLASSVSKINLGNFNSSNVTNMSSLFGNCANLKSVNIEVLDTSNVEDMIYMFAQCQSLEELNLANFNTKKVTNMRSMFKGCCKLKSIDLSNFDTANVTDISEMFGYCIDLQEIKGFEGLDFKNVTSCGGLFKWCESLRKIDLSSLKTLNKAARTSSLFGHCYSLEACEIPENVRDRTPEEFSQFIIELEVDPYKFEDTDIIDLSRDHFIPSEVLVELHYRSPRENLGASEESDNSKGKTNFF